jgi:vesicle transport through interaction with t-SNAREs 1
MSTFNDLNQSCQSNFKKAKELVPRIQNGSKDEIKNANNSITSIIKEIERTIKAMEVQAKAAPPSSRRNLQDTITELKADLSKIRQSVQKANDSLSRTDLFDGAKATKIAEKDIRDKALVAAETTGRTTQKLQQATTMLNETQDIGVSVIDNMQGQREALLRTKNKAGNVNDLTYTARGILRGMQARAVTNKFLLGFAILLLLACIGGVVYYGYFANPKK